MVERERQDRGLDFLAVKRDCARRRTGGIQHRAGHSAAKLGNGGILHRGRMRGKRRWVSWTLKKVDRAPDVQLAKVEGVDDGRGFYSLERWAL